MMAYKSVKFTYTTSLEKWRGIRSFAEANYLETKCIDAMIARIEKVGDASLDDAFDYDTVDSMYVMDIRDIHDYLDSMYTDDIQPCPHCCVYVDCEDCPLWGGDNNCCDEWAAAKNEAKRVLKGG